MKNFLTWSLIPTAAILLSACNAIIIDGYPNIPANYNDGDFDRAAARGAIATIVVGQPFSAQSGNVEDTVRELMKNQVGIFPVSFVPQPGANTTQPYKVVVVFNPRPNVDNRTICQTERQTPVTATSPGQMSITMVFCDGNKLKSGISGRAGGVRDQSDPKFAALVRQVANAMIPPIGLQRQLQYDNSN